MSMNVFRLIGDALHVIAIIIMLIKLIRTKSCAGISARSQILFALVYTTRYLDLVAYISIYNTLMKILFIFSSYVIVLLITVLFKRTYERKEDIFLTEFLIFPSFMMAICFNHEFTPLEILWTFSIYLEAVAILPQFYMIHKKKQMQRSMFFYLLALGCYRGFYIFNWIYRYFNEGHTDVIADGAGVLYAFLYIVGVTEILFNEIKITDEESGTLLQSNIFFISNNGQWEKQLNPNCDQGDIEKNHLITSKGDVEKV